VNALPKPFAEPRADQDRTNAESAPRNGKPVPVLLMVRELGLGGIERDVAKLALGFDRTRFLPYVATYKPEGPRFDELQRAGVPVLRLQFPSLLSLQALAAARRFAAFVRDRKIRIVHAFDPISVFGVPLARCLRVPVVLSSQLGHRDLHDSRTRRQLKLVDRWSDSIVVNCEALRRHLVNEHGVRPSKIELCYNGVDGKEFFPAPCVRPPAVAGAPLVIGAVCVLRPEKGLDLLQSAFARVRHLTPGCKLLIVGDGPELPRLQANGEALGLRDVCVFLPAVASVAPLMRAIDIFVSSSHSEAFSNAILEAMACGCCALGSRVGGTPELLADGERGLLFEPGSVDDLADKLARLMTDESLRKSFGKNAADFARTKLNIGINLERTMQIYRMLLERRRGLR